MSNLFLFLFGIPFLLGTLYPIHVCVEVKGNNGGLHGSSVRLEETEIGKTDKKGRLRTVWMFHLYNKLGLTATDPRYIHAWGKDAMFTLPVHLKSVPPLRMIPPFSPACHLHLSFHFALSDPEPATKPASKPASKPTSKS